MRLNKDDLWVIRDALYDRAKNSPLVEDRQVAAATCRKVVAQLQRYYSRRVVDPFVWDQYLMHRCMPSDFLNSPPKKLLRDEIIKLWRYIRGINKQEAV